MKDLHLVVRASGERTADIARQIATVQLGDASAVTVVSEAPFEEALRVAYGAGIAAGRKWTMTLDADVLLRSGAVSDLLAEAERMPAHYAQAWGYAFDKVTGICRPVGTRIYRTALLPLAVKHIPRSGKQMRPESFILNQLSMNGHPSRPSRVAVGLHDFEQYHRDLYRKARVHAVKHPNYLDRMIKRCVDRRSEDADYKVVLQGLWDGLTTDESVTIDARRYADKAQQVLESLKIREKEPMSQLPVDDDTISQIFDRLMKEEARCSNSLPSVEAGSRKFRVALTRQLEQHGPLDGTRRIICLALRKAASLLDPPAPRL